MEHLQTLLDNSEIPVITAFLLGLLTALSPCPLATNITAIGFISKDIDNRKQIFKNGILYTLGRVLAYSVLGAILIMVLRKGADMFSIQKGISQWGELLLAPALILIGLFMLFGDKFHLPKFGFSVTEKTEKIKGAGAVYCWEYCLLWHFALPVDYSISVCSFPCLLLKVKDICYLCFLLWQRGFQLHLLLGFWLIVLQG